jgi:DNA-binding CsgD family transcriptional regulator
MARVKDALNHGATYLLEKPFRAEDLSRALASVWEEPKGLGHFVERALDRAELTAKERDVARLLLKGLSTREMAGVTGNTEKTLKHHIASIFHKFGVASRAELFTISDVASKGRPTAKLAELTGVGPLASAIGPPLARLACCAHCALFILVKVAQGPPVGDRERNIDLASGLEVVKAALGSPSFKRGESPGWRD